MSPSFSGGQTSEKMPMQEIEVDFVYWSPEKMKNFLSYRQWGQVTTLDAEATDRVLSSQQTNE